MSIDGIASNIQAYQTAQLSSNSASSALSPFAPSTGAKSNSASTAAGSLQNLSSGLQNVLLQMQSSGGNITEAGNPTQAAPGMPHHHHHAHTQQGAAKTASATSAG